MAEHRRPPEVVEASGFYLRRHRVDDAAAIAAAVAESLAELGEWMPWAHGPAAELDAQRRRLEEAVPNWERDVEYVYLILRPGEERALGCVGLHRRVGPSALERKERLKLVDPLAVRALARTKPVLMPDDPDVLTFDVTGTGPDETARAILDHTWALRGTGRP